MISPIALEAVRRGRSAPLVAAPEAWMREERYKLSRHAEVAGAMDYMLKRWASFTRSSMTAGSASPTTRPNERCVAWRWGVLHRINDHRASRLHELLP